jgi:hypothetical protein
VVQAIDAAMGIFPFDSVEVVLPAPFHVHQVEEPGAVGVLVEHADGEKVFLARYLVHDNPRFMNASARATGFNLLSSIRPIVPGSLDLSRGESAVATLIGSCDT